MTVSAAGTWQTTSDVFSGLSEEKCQRGEAVKISRSEESLKPPERFQGADIKVIDGWIDRGEEKDWKYLESKVKCQAPKHRGCVVQGRSVLLKNSSIRVCLKVKPQDPEASVLRRLDFFK